MLEDLSVKSIEFIVGLLVSLIVGLWAYSKYILEHGTVPHVQLNLEANPLGSQNAKCLLEILIHVKNVGKSLLVLDPIFMRLLYLDKKDEELGLSSNAEEKIYGRVKFSHSYTKEVVTLNSKTESAFPILQHRTFVQPGVDQVYTVIVGLPESATFVLIHAQFRYNPEISKLKNGILKLSKYLGLVRYSLEEITEPHTIERAFSLGNKDSSMSVNKPS